MPQTTLGGVSGSRVTSQAVRYRERLWVPLVVVALGFGLAALIATEVNMGVRALPNWLPFAVLFAVAAGVAAVAGPLGGAGHRRGRHRRTVGRPGTSPGRP